MSSEQAPIEAPLPIVIVGHVDHGKSTLVGRLLHDTNSLPDGKVDELRAQAERRNSVFEWSFVMDALQLERDQGITVDTTRIWFSTEKRRYVIIDAPGHKAFLKNMITGAAAAEAAVLVIDAEQGVSEQTRRHAYLLELLGISQVVVAVNKIDLIDHDQARFMAVAAEARVYLKDLGIEPLEIVPLAARHGVNIVDVQGDNEINQIPWWHGPTLVTALDQFLPRVVASEQPLRLPIQDVYRRDDQRVLAGRIVAGHLRVGDSVRFAPGSQTARVKSIEAWKDSSRLSAGAGQSVAFTLDQEIFVERGHIAGPLEHGLSETNRISARLFWLDNQSLKTGDRLTLKIGHAEHSVSVEHIDQLVDIEDISQDAVDVNHQQIEQHDVAEVTLRSRSRMAVDLYDDFPATGRGVLVRDDKLVGGCIIRSAEDIARTNNLTSVDQTVSVGERARANGHRGGVLWLTGLSGSGKSTLAMALQRRLFERGEQVYVLDGDNVRQGLNSDLGFGPDARSENIRRIAEVANLFADAGFIVITAFISPYREDRDNARTIVGDGFQEVYIKAALEVCEGRDPKGLYQRARAGQIPEFTGISAPYEEPLQADCIVDTGKLTLETSVSTLIEHLDRHNQLKSAPRRIAS